MIQIPLTGLLHTTIVTMKCQYKFWMKHSNNNSGWLIHNF